MKSNQPEGYGLITILLLIFVVLKLTHNIHWSWFWVLSPYLIPLLIIGIVDIVRTPFVLYDRYITRKHRES